MPRVPQVREILFNDEEIGMGFNSESGLAVGTALEGFTVPEPVLGQVVSSSITIINSHEELMSKMNMSFAAQGRYGFFSGSAKAEFSDSTNFNSTSTFVHARCVVRNPIKRGRGFRVKEEAKTLLDSNRFDEFKRAFGDSFVRGLQTGGEFYSVIRITSVSTTTQSSLAASLQAEANGLLASGSFQAAFETATKEESTRSEFEATMFQMAGSGPTISPVAEISDVIARFKSFPTIVAAAPVAYETEVATYDTLPLPLPTPVEQEDFLLAMLDAREKKLRYIQTRNDLDFARRNPVFFEGLPSNDVLVAASNVYTKLINAVMAHAIKLSRGEMNPPRLFDPTVLDPPIQEPAPILLQRASVPVPPPPNATAMLDLVGEFSAPVTSILACVRLEDVDHCLRFLRDELGRTPLRNHDPRDIGNFFFFAFRNGINIDLKGDPNPSGKTIRAQFPPAGFLLTRGSIITIDHGP
jgi:hypothetical protein